MAIFQFPDEVIVRSIDTGETLELAKFTDTGALNNIRTYILAEQLTGNEILTLELRESDGSTVRATSDPYTLSTALEGAAYWLGWIRFDFPTKPNLGTDLRLFAKVSNYTYVEDVNTLNYVKTYLNPTYPTAEGDLRSLPADIQIYKYE
jgi:hypothetical protein